MYMTIEYRTAFPDFEDDYYNDLYYEWELVDSLLLLNEYFSLDDDDIWQGPGVKVTLFMPEGQRFRISKNLEEIIDKNESPMTIYGDYYGRELKILNNEVMISE
jgi:hypothetical protein